MKIFKVLKSFMKLIFFFVFDLVFIAFLLIFAGAFLYAVYYMFEAVFVTGSLYQLLAGLFIAFLMANFISQMLDGASIRIADFRERIESFQKNIQDK